MEQDELHQGLHKARFAFAILCGNWDNRPSLQAH